MLFRARGRAGLSGTGQPSAHCLRVVRRDRARDGGHRGRGMGWHQWALSRTGSLPRAGAPLACQWGCNVLQAESGLDSWLPVGQVPVPSLPLAGRGPGRTPFSGLVCQLAQPLQGQYGRTWRPELTRTCHRSFLMLFWAEIPVECGGLSGGRAIAPHTVALARGRASFPCAVQRFDGVRALSFCIPWACNIFAVKQHVAMHRFAGGALL